MVKKHFSFYVLGVLLFFNFFVWQAVFAEERRGELLVAFLDIGQGDAIYIEAPNGNQMIIDGGPNGKILEELSKVMPPYDHSIDMIVVTNPDADHYAGFIDVLKNYDVAKIMEPGTVSDTATYEVFEKAVGDEGSEKIFARRGMNIKLSEDVSFNILFPDRNVSESKINDGSIIGKLTYGNTSVMFTGDTTKKIENYLVGLDGKNLKSDVLKVAHHGSRTSTSENFVGFASPLYAVISDGKNNRYGHPHQETLDTLQKFGVKTFRTDQVGTVRMISDGEKILFK